MQGLPASEHCPALASLLGRLRLLHILGHLEVPLLIHGRHSLCSRGSSRMAVNNPLSKILALSSKP